MFGNSVALSEDGRFIAATDVTPGQPFSPQLFDVHTGGVTSLPGSAPDGSTIPIDISADGRVVALYSEATNLDPLDTNTSSDIYLWDAAAGTVELASKRLDTGAALPTGAAQCGNGPGHMLASGAGVCVRTNDPLLAADVDGVTDAWLVPR